GIWVKSGGSWSHPAADSGFSRGDSVSWVPGSSTVWVYDKGPLSGPGGLWKSTNSGTTFTKYCAPPSQTVSQLSGYLAASPTDTANVYVSLDSGLYKVGTSTCRWPTPLLFTPTQPRPLAQVSTGTVCA